LGNSFPAVSDFRIPSDGAERVSDAANHMKGLVFLGEAVVIFLASEMEFSDEIDGFACVAQLVMPSPFRTVVGEGVVPVSDFVHVLAGCERGPRGYANGACRIGSAESRASGGEGIKVRCFGFSVAVAS